jgi:3-oxoadipate enol-lactonase
MPFVTSNKRDIYYERHGAGPAILFLHGAGSNVATWWQQLPAFTPKYTCLTMDIRSFGRSVAPPDEFSLELFVGDALAVFAREGIERAAVVGQSLGGMIGLRFALRHPEHVTAFVACDTSLAIDHPTLVDSIERRFKTVSAVSIEQRSLGAWFLKAQPALAAIYAQINHFNPSAHSIAPEVWREAVVRLNQPENLLARRRTRPAGLPDDVSRWRRRPDCSAGGHARTRPAPARERGRPRRGAAHSAYFEKPLEFNQTVFDFLRRRADS